MSKTDFCSHSRSSRLQSCALWYAGKYEAAGLVPIDRGLYEQLIAKANALVSPTPSASAKSASHDEAQGYASELPLQGLHSSNGSHEEAAIDAIPAAAPKPDLTAAKLEAYEASSPPEPSPTGKAES